MLSHDSVCLFGDKNPAIGRCEAPNKASFGGVRPPAPHNERIMKSAIMIFCGTVERVSGDDGAYHAASLVRSLSLKSHLRATTSLPSLNIYGASAWQTVDHAPVFYALFPSVIVAERHLSQAALEALSRRILPAPALRGRPLLHQSGLGSRSQLQPALRGGTGLLPRQQPCHHPAVLSGLRHGAAGRARLRRRSDRHGAGTDPRAGAAGHFRH